MSVIIDIPLVDSFGKNIVLDGCLTIPNESNNSLVIFVHGSGSSKDSTRNQYLSKELNKMGIATFLFDLLTKEEQESDEKVEKIIKEVPGLTLNKFNISLLSDRLIKVTDYVLHQISRLQHKELKVGYFGASTGSAAAIIAALSLKSQVIKTIVSRGGRPDLVLSTSFSQNNLFLKI